MIMDPNFYFPFKKADSVYMYWTYLHSVFLSPSPPAKGPVSSCQSLLSALFVVVLFSCVFMGQAVGKEESKKEELNAYDPFADYSEFENTADEQKNINFFQHGRFITLGVQGGVKLFTMNMASFYNIGPTYGGYLNYFFDMNFAIQFAVTASSHYIAFDTGGGQSATPGAGQAGATANNYACVNSATCFLGSADFISMGIDFKYFLDKSLFNKNFQWLAPYLFIGVLRSSLIMTATFGQTGEFFDDSGYGLNMGLGLEFHFMKKIHFGLQYAFQFVTLGREYLPLSLSGGKSLSFRPYGDWMNVTMILGVNF